MLTIQIAAGIVLGLVLWNYPVPIVWGVALIVAAYVGIALVAWLVRTLLGTHPK